MGKTKKNKLHFRSKLALLQFCLVLPVIALLLFALINGIRDSAVRQIEASRSYSLQSAAGSFDQIYARMLKLLEKPYADKSLFTILTTEYGPGDVMQKRADDILLPKLLRSNFLYFEPNVLSVTMVSEITGSVYYGRSLPTTSINVHNEDWYNLKNSVWYKSVTAVETPVVSPATENELYLNSGLTISISQRLKDVRHNRLIGAVRIDLSLWSLNESWRGFSGADGSIFAVLDQAGQLVYASSEELLAQYPLLSAPDVNAWEREYRLTSKTAPESGFQFLYLSPPDTVFFQPQLLFGLPLLIMLAGILYVLVFISWSTRHISHPIRLLKTAMLQGQEKDLTARCEPLPGEMGELSDAFNSLMERIGELIGEVTRNEQEKARLSYEVLQSKVNPHFLYNTLNAIRWKADMIGSKDISHSLESLSSLLRFSIKCTDDVIPFETELGQLENYIQIMRVRYGDNVEIGYDIDEDCLAYQCLKFLIQPAVENCYIHAFSSGLQENPSIQVSVICEETCIVVTVEDNGDGMTSEQIDKLFRTDTDRGKAMFVGIGIGNVRERIITQFGAGYGLEVTSERGRFTRVTAVIPKIKCEECSCENSAG